jgi:hypothetical protein
LENLINLEQRANLSLKKSDITGNNRVRRG